MIATHKITSVSITANVIILNIDNKIIEIPLDKVSVKLKTASDIQRNFYKISPSGYGIHWPLVDEDLAVESLLKLAK